MAKTGTETDAAEAKLKKPGRAMEKPRLIEFLTRGIPLNVALAILARWETLTDAELMALGFGPEAQIQLIADFLGRTPFH